MISLAHSPDADDVFMFYALKRNLVDSEGLSFSYTALDTDTLNQRACDAQFDISAISAAAYPRVAERYAILPHGASVGRDYGPVIVATAPMSLSDLSGLRLAIPGEITTSAALARIVAPEAKLIVVPIVPYDTVFASLRSEHVDAAVLIHEGQITYRDRGLELVIDLGKWWRKQTACPLPLGINVIRTSLGPELIEKVSRVLHRSICYALDNRDKLLDELLCDERLRGSDLTSAQMLTRYLDMYANNDTRSFSEECRRALDVLFVLMGCELEVHYAA